MIYANAILSAHEAGWRSPCKAAVGSIVPIENMLDTWKQHHMFAVRADAGQTAGNSQGLRARMCRQSAYIPIQ